MTATAGFYPPTLAPNFAIGSSTPFVDKIVAIRASNGGLRGRSFQSTRKATFYIRHSLLNAAALEDVHSAYDLNRNRTFQLTHLGSTYTCIWTAPFKETPLFAGAWDVELYCEEV